MNKNKIYVTPLPFYVINAATNGDDDAISEVLKHFSGYIAKLSTKWLYDKYGNTYMCIDETLQAELESKLIQGVLKFKIR